MGLYGGKVEEMRTFVRVLAVDFSTELTHVFLEEVVHLLEF